MRSMTFAIVMLSIDLAIVAAGQFMPSDSGIQQIYHTWWFFGFVALLLLSVVSCQARRVPALLRATLQPTLAHRQEFYTAAGRDPSLQWSATAAATEADTALRAALAARRYRISAVTQDGATYYHADRYRLFRFGTVLSHLGIVLLVAMIMWGALAGLTVNNVVLEPGQSHSVGHGTGLTVRVDAFDVRFYPNGEPKAFPDRLTVSHTGSHPQPVSATIDVNTPLTVDGVSFSQSTYGAAAYLVVLDRNRHPLPTLLMGPNGPASAPAQQTRLGFDLLAGGAYSAGLAVLPGRGLGMQVQFTDPVPNQGRTTPTLFLQLFRLDKKKGVVPLASPELPVRQATIPGLGQRQLATWHWQDLQVVFLINRVTGLSITSNPAINYIYASFIIILLGLFGVLYFPYTRIWAAVLPTSGGALLLLRGRGEKSRVAFARAFAALGADLGQRLPGGPPEAAETRPAAVALP